MRNELLHGKRCSPRAESVDAMFGYINVFQCRRRLMQFGYSPLIEHERKFDPKAA